MDDRVVGVLGGGQLGRMMIAAGSLLQIPIVVVDPSENSPAKQISSPFLLSQPSLQHVTGSFNDPKAILELCKMIDILTIEIEHVNVDVLKKIASDSTVGRLGKGIKIYPAPKVIEIIQDKFIQKSHLSKNQIPVAEFLQITSDFKASIKSAGEKFSYPLMLKSRKLAYDGRGNFLIKSESQIDEAVKALVPPESSDDKNEILYAEKFAGFICEVSVMVVRSEGQDITSYPPVETVHKDNICHLVFSPLRPKRGGLSKDTKGKGIGGESINERARRVAESAIASFGEGAVGVFAVEMFLMADDTFLVNEIAPRPHNSYHHTIESFNLSQFSAHLRAILSLPHPPIQAIAPSAAMLNILGASSSIKDLKPLIQKGLETPGCFVHLYGKEGCRKGRKMGHITIVGESDEQVRERLKPLLEALPESQKDPREISPSPPNQYGLSHPHPLVSIIMGSDSDLPVMLPATNILTSFSIPFELSIVSAHRTPLRMVEFTKNAAERGVRVIIAGAGGAAHLPGMVAAMTSLPVIGVPVKGSTLDGVDSLYSIVQMPRGIPVATVAINNSTNAALLAARIIGTFIPTVKLSMDKYLDHLEDQVMGKVERLSEVGWKEYKVEP